jgi:hypothetical protein
VCVCVWPSAGYDASQKSETVALTRRYPSGTELFFSRRGSFFYYYDFIRSYDSL